jgi:hypothetical protein
MFFLRGFSFERRQIQSDNPLEWSKGENIPGAVSPGQSSILINPLQILTP